MKNSEKIRLYLQNKENPLKDEFENECKALSHQSDNIIDKFNTFSFSSIAIVIVIFVISFFIDFLNSALVFWLAILWVMVLGVLFLILCSITGSTNKKENEIEIEKLKEKYAKKGYIHHNMDTLFCRSGKCGEYKYDGYDERFVCSLDFTPLSYEKKQWCQTPGNCINCEKLKRTLWPD